MKKLGLNQMEGLEGGGNNPSEDFINGIGLACVGVGLLSIAGSIFTFGASLASTFCTGSAGGALAYTVTH